MNNKKIFILLISGIILFSAGKVLAQEGPMLTFRFDDGLNGQYNYAAPILAQYGFSATEYIFTDPPQEGDWEEYISWAQIEDLCNVYGWEIGSHSKSHPYLTQLSDAQTIEELSGSKEILESHGFIIKSFASPFGDYDDRVMSYIKQYYESHGSAWPFGYNSYPFDNYEYLVQEVGRLTPVATVKSWIDTAFSERKWLVLLFHEIVLLNPKEYEYTKANFEQIVDYVYTKNIPVVTVSQSLAGPVLPPPPPGQNLILNPSFELATGGWADNWTRTDSSHIVLDVNNNGFSPDSKNSLKIVGGADSYNVYTSSLITVDPSRTYNLSAYFNCPSFASGGVDIFIDEYDSNGNWLNWKWQAGIWNSYVGFKSAVYTPSLNTSKIMVWIEGVAGSDLTCYVDEIVLEDISGIPPLPPPPPPGENLVLNPSFELTSGDWADNWARTDTANVSLDANNNGFSPEPKNSLKFISSSSKASAYTTEFIDVDPSRTYNFSAYFNCSSFSSGGVDIFIDEYDSNGNWLNWKWQAGIWNGYVGSKSAVYVPAPGVGKIMIWIEGVAGSDLTCYIDEIVLAPLEN